MICRGALPNTIPARPVPQTGQDGTTMDDLDVIEIRRLDPRDVCGWVSLLSTLVNIVYSAFNSLYTIDALISISAVLGLLSLLNRNRIVPKLSLGLLALHLLTVFALRVM